MKIDKKAFYISEKNEAVEWGKEFEADNEGWDCKEERERMAWFYADNNYVRKIHSFSAEVSKKNYCHAVWVEMTIETTQAFYKVGFYLEDFWELAGNTNADDIRDRAYIRKFVEVR